MANMVYCTMYVKAPDNKQLMDFIYKQTSAIGSDLALGASFILYLYDDIGPTVDKFSLKDNEIMIQFQTKWSPPSDEIKAMVKQYKNLTFKVEAYEEFNEFAYEFYSAPDSYNENFRKLSNEEIENSEIYIGELINKLALLDKNTIDNILEEVDEVRARNYHRQEKFDYIKNNIQKLTDYQINKIYDIIKRPLEKPKVQLVEIDDDDEWN